MATEDEKTRLALAGQMLDKELYRMLSLFAEMRDVCAVIWPGNLLDALTLDNIQAMLRTELDKRMAAKGAS